VPGEPVEVDLELDATAFVFTPGTRVRLDLATSDFPSSWPPPETGTLQIDLAATTLFLPVLDGPQIADAPTFAPGDERAHRPDHVVWEVRDDVGERVRRVVIDHGGVRGQASNGAGVLDRYGGEVGVGWDDPGRAWAEGSTTYELTWPEATVRTESRGSLQTDRDTWRLELELDVYEDGEHRFHRRWEREVPRDLQ
jgi:hypothetical protein